jgi:hypothetical protein
MTPNAVLLLSGELALSEVLEASNDTRLFSKVAVVVEAPIPMNEIGATHRQHAINASRVAIATTPQDEYWDGVPLRLDVSTP